MALGLILHFALTPPAAAQSGARGGGGFGAQAQPQSFEGRFWNWMRNARYRNWAPWPGQSGEFYPGQSPHGAFLKMYVNREVAANPDGPPAGSVVVKENYGENKELMAITVMYKVADYAPESGDWYWVKYNPDGSVAMKGDMRLAGKAKGCIQCHGNAEGDDYLFANDG